VSEKLRGRIEHRDLEGGIFHLVQSGGAKTTLIGKAALLKPLIGAEVEVVGAMEAEGGFGFAMAGPQLRVESVRKI
jgi:hypothetical protein